MARAIVKSHSSSSIGSIKQSMLDEATFQSIHGTGWVLMDGRDLSITNPGSAYEILTGQSVLPDSRGRFLRGLDTTQGVDPDFATRTLGGSQNDAFGSHNHFTHWIGSSSNLLDGSSESAVTRSRYGVEWADMAATTNTPNSGKSSSSGISETRPKNIAVNIFIKINE